MSMWILHYGEIGLKRNNRGFFEKKLEENLRKAGAEKIERLHGRFLIEGDEKVLKKTSGIVYYAKAEKTNLNIEEIKKASLKIIRKGSFKVDCRRENKKFEKTSPQIEREVGECLIEKGNKVQMKNPEQIIYIEILKSIALIYNGKTKGMGGLPVGTAGKILCLLSGGIDSPVASIMMNKRGTKNIYVSFLTKSTKQEAGKKIKKIVKKLAEYNLGAKLYIVDISEFRKELQKAEEKYRMILFRREIFRLGKEIAKIERCKAFCTGDSLAQVASQTLDNLSVIQEAAKFPVLCPLIGWDKEEIIKKAEKYETFEISKEKCTDVCSSLSPKSPETHAKLLEILEQEKKLEKKELKYKMYDFKSTINY